MSSTASDPHSSGHVPDEGAQNLGQTASASSHLIDRQLIDKISIVKVNLVLVVDDWLKKRPDTVANNDLITNISSLYWSIQNEYLSKRQDDDEDIIMLEAMRDVLGKASLALSEPLSLDRKSRIDELSDTLDRLLVLQRTLEEVLTRMRKP